MHLRDCTEDRKATRQWQVDFERNQNQKHEENKRELSDFKADIKNGVNRILVGVALTLLSVLGWIASNAVHFKIEVQ